MEIFAILFAMGMGYLFGTVCSAARHEWGRSNDRAWSERDERMVQDICRLRREAVERGEHIVP